MESRKERYSRILKQEKEKIRDLPPRKKAAYILDYYWLWLLGIFCVIFLTGYIIYQAFFSVKDYWFYAMYANTMENGGNASPLWHDFVDYAGFDTSQKRVEMNASFWFDPSVRGGTDNSYYQAFVALTESGALDVVVMGNAGLEGIGSSGRLLDLHDARCTEILKNYEDHLIYCIPYDTEYSEEPVPVGIDVTDSLLTTKYHLYGEPCALGISAYTQRIESAELFLEFIFQEEERGGSDG